MKNIICMWSGAVEDILAGWALCDGNNGTPDLRNRFVIGAGDTYTPGDSGGSVNHTHAFTSDSHSHVIPQEAGCPGAGPHPCLTTENTESEVASGTTEANGVLQPYYALCYIMKL